ncbi:MAG: esterase-like activity of phytase family protein [Myxococcota bacterium]
MFCHELPAEPPASPVSADAWVSFRRSIWIGLLLGAFVGFFACSPAAQVVRRDDALPPLVERFQVFYLPTAQLSNPSGLAFAGTLQDGRVQLFAVCDGSAMTKDGFTLDQVVVSLVVDPSGVVPLDITPIKLDPQAAPCDLESIDVDPRDGQLWVADERVAGVPACGGTLDGGAARSRVFKIDRFGKLLEGPYEVDVVNTKNNGLEAIAIRMEPDGAHLYALKEWSLNGKPEIFNYRLTGQPSQPLEKVATYELEVPGRLFLTQSAADFGQQDGRLRILDRDGLELLTASLPPGTPSGKVTAEGRTLLGLVELASGIKLGNDGELRQGMIEGLTSTPDGGLFILLDNNGQPLAEGDKRARLIYLKLGAAGAP